MMKSILRLFRDLVASAEVHYYLLAIVNFLVFLAATGFLYAITVPGRIGLYSGIFIALFILAALLLNTILLRINISRNSEIKNLQNTLLQQEMILRQTGEIQPPIYAIRVWKEVYDIVENGDTYYLRECSIEYVNQSVYWYLFGITLINGEAIKNIEDLGLKVVNLKTGNPLNKVPLIFTPERVRLAVVLDPVVTIKEPTFSVGISLLWKGLHKPLIQSHIDNGSLSIVNPTKIIDLTFISPPGNKFTDFQISPVIGNWKINRVSNDRSEISFRAEDVAPGVYSYWLRTDDEK